MEKKFREEMSDEYIENKWQSLPLVQTKGCSRKGKVITAPHVQL